MRADLFVLNHFWIANWGAHSLEMFFRAGLIRTSGWMNKWWHRERLLSVLLPITDETLADLRWLTQVGDLWAHKHLAKKIVTHSQFSKEQKEVTQTGGRVPEMEESKVGFDRVREAGRDGENSDSGGEQINSEVNTEVSQSSNNHKRMTLRGCDWAVIEKNKSRGSVGKRQRKTLVTWYFFRPVYRKTRPWGDRHKTIHVQ